MMPLRVHNNLKNLMPRICRNFWIVFSQDPQQSLGNSDQDLPQSLGAATQNMHQSLGNSGPNIPNVQGSDIQMPYQTLDDDIQILQQIPDAATQNMHQSLGNSGPNIPNVQGSDIQMPYQTLDDDIQILQQIPDAATQNMHQSLGNSGPNIPNVQGSDIQMPYQTLDDDIQILQQIPDAATQDPQQFLYVANQIFQYLQNSNTQSIQQPHGMFIQILQQAPDDATRSAQNSLGNSASHNVHRYQGISTQTLQHYQDAPTWSTQKLNQDKARAEVSRLTRDYKAQGRIVSKIDLQIHSDKQKDTKVNDVIKTIAIKLQETGISDDERLRLLQTIRDLKIVSDQLASRHKENHQHYIAAKERRRNVNAALQLSKGNYKLVDDYNSNNGAQVGLSPNTCYNMNMLETQYDKALEDIDASLAEQKRIDNLVLSSDDDSLKAQSAQLENTIQDLQIYRNIAGGILWKHKYKQPIGVWISESLDSYLQMLKI
ncbi:hypothetical protein BASA60_008128 [Batrachochytrium salamandrivorans]|nr:hypothetical protein BASA60_008128 [Batrachochytrium salamandrivorans]